MLATSHTPSFNEIEKHNPMLVQTDHDSENADALDVGALTRWIRQGSEEAFEIFYDSYRDRVYRLALMMSRGDVQAARDVLQSVMIKVARKLPVVRKEEKLWRWLARVARNEWIDHCRRNASFASRLRGEFGRFQVESEYESDNLMIEKLDEAIQDLSADERELLEQFYFDRRSYRDIAVLRARTTKAVESKLARIRIKIRNTITRSLKDE
ncbi:MAG TPA: sigma-70 family RNA polymerase sigma factor [Verrucomicrobia bacterium]|nr:sigma-70 family RNA polymerase sigma factor [Verrucomicrobiota bacterium]